jgi:hypothetical protein
MNIDSPDTGVANKLRSILLEPVQLAGRRK